MPKPKLKRVALTWENGETTTLDGAAAEHWHSVLVDQAFFCHNHGVITPEFPWVKAMAKESTEP